MKWIPSKRFNYWLALEVFAAVFPILLMVWYHLLAAEFTFERFIANPELAFFTVMITAITLADLNDFAGFINADQRAVYFTVLFFSFFVSLFFFFMLFSVGYDAELFPLFVRKLPDGTYLPKLSISLPSMLLAIVMFITCFRLELAFSRVGRRAKSR